MADDERLIAEARLLREIAIELRNHAAKAVRVLKDYRIDYLREDIFLSEGRLDDFIARLETTEVLNGQPDSQVPLLPRPQDTDLDSVHHRGGAVDNGRSIAR